MKTHKIIASALSVICLMGCSPKENTQSTGQVVAIKVKTATLTPMRFRRQIRVQGCIQPVNSAKIAARMAGSIDALKVKEGDRVKKGDILFQTDQVNLQNQVLIAEQNLKVAKENKTIAEADLKIARTNLEKARLDYERDETLFKRNVITQKDFESATVTWKNAQATTEKTETALSYRDVLIKQSQTSLDIARKNLADSIIRAPYDGVITAKYHETGEFVSNGMAVLALEDQTHLEASLYLSSIYYPLLSPETTVVLSLRGQELCRAKLSYISPSIDSTTRTFEIKAALLSQPNLISGTLCDVTVILAERDGVGLPSDAVLSRAGGQSVVFAVNDSSAEEIPAMVGFTTDGFTEILNANDLQNRQFVIEGQYFLNDGSRVEVQ
ncbi:MAG: efflux RND transporter periplasmic adaptor subunit [Lentisphaeria bacterium]|nr:efflux RND transporter periplasmic adaptor subunit [Lentisphaeria bacterium]